MPQGSPGVTPNFPLQLSRPGSGPGLKPLGRTPASRRHVGCRSRVAVQRYTRQPTCRSGFGTRALAAQLSERTLGGSRSIPRGRTRRSAAYPNYCSFGRGNALQESGRWNDAIGKFEQALALLPDPTHKWEAAMWLFVAMGDVAFQSGQFERAREAFRQAMLCPGAIGNPFVHLRRGQTFFELGDMRLAEEELAGAYMLEGAEIFEHEDPKYFQHLKTVLKPPAAGGW